MGKFFSLVNSCMIPLILHLSLQSLRYYCLTLYQKNVCLLQL